MNTICAGYVGEVKRIAAELKEMTVKRKKITTQKQKMEKSLYEYMLAHNMASFDGYTIEKLKNIVMKREKKKQDEKAIAILKLFRDAEVKDPILLYEAYKATQTGPNSDVKKKRKDKMRDAVSLFMSNGIADPTDLWERIQSVLRPNRKKKS